LTTSLVTRRFNWILS